MNIQTVTTAKSLGVSPDHLENASTHNRALDILARFFGIVWSERMKGSKKIRHKRMANYDGNPESARSEVKGFKRALRNFCGILTFAIVCGIVAYMAFELHTLKSAWLSLSFAICSVVFGLTAYAYGASNVWGFCFPGFTAFKLAKAWEPWRKIAEATEATNALENYLDHRGLRYEPVFGASSKPTAAVTHLINGIDNNLKDLVKEIRECESEGRPIKRFFARRKFALLYKLAKECKLIKEEKTWTDYFKN